MSVAQSDAGYITIDFDLSGVDRFFDRLDSGLVDISGNALGEGFLAAGDVYMEGIRERFETFSRGDSVGWPPLSPRYAARKERKLGHQLVLIYTGAMQDSLAPGQPNNIRFVLPNGSVVGTDDPKAHFHQYGTSRMPARPILVPPDDPSMPSNTLDDMTFDIEKGFQKLIDECAQGT